MELYLIVVLPIFASLLLYLIPWRLTTWLCTALYTGVFAMTLYIFWRVRFLGEIITTKSGEEFLGITLYCDLTASVFLVLVSFLFLCVFAYTNLSGHTHKLYSFLITVLEGLVMLIFLSRDLFNIYVAVEVATIVCAILIMYKRENRSIYDGIVYLMSNITGMLFFLLGIGMIYRQCGVLDFDGIAQAIASGSAGPMSLAYALIMTGICLKCAMFPLHFWLPLAHGTPGALTGVSALLSGLYVKCGIYLFVRVQDLFSPQIDTSVFFFWVGVITSVTGICMAVCQKDIKLILAYHTISQLGLIVAGLSTGSDTAQAGAMLHIINHALFKSLLFLTAGILIEQYKTRNIYDIKGVMRSSPLAGIAVAAGILGITGAPFFNGSISKYLLAQGGTVADYMFLIINLGTALSFVKFGKILFGPKKQSFERRNMTSISVVLVLSVLCLISGIFASPLVDLIFDMELEIGMLGYLKKGLIWAFSIAAAALFYNKVLSRCKRLKAGIDFNIQFNHIVMCIGGCFVVLLAAGYLGQV